jgi:uncharacterized membrane protein
MNLYPITISSTLLVFFVSGIIGWVILSIFSQMLTGFLWENYRIPFKPMIAFGAVIVYLISPYFSQYDIWIQLIFYGLLLSLLELVMFVISDKIFNVRFRCYYNGNRLALIYSIYWAILAVILSQYLNNVLNKSSLILFIILVILVIVFRDGRDGIIILDRNPNQIKIC